MSFQQRRTDFGKRLRDSFLPLNRIFTYIDSIQNLVQFAQARHFQKWPILGISGPAPEVGGIATTYNAELDTLKAWINLRLQWLDENIPGLCNSFTNVKEYKNPLSTLKYFPNPGKGIVHFEGYLYGKTPFWLNIYDGTGKQIDSILLQTENLNLDYFFKRKGVYFFTINNKNVLIESGKIIVF